MACKLLKRLVPRVGVEPTRPFGQRILRTLEAPSPGLTKRYEPVFIGLATVKVSLRLASYQHVRPPSWPHLSTKRKLNKAWITEGESLLRQLRKEAVDAMAQLTTSAPHNILRNSLPPLRRRPQPTNVHRANRRKKLSLFHRGRSARLAIDSTTSRYARLKSA